MCKRESKGIYSTIGHVLTFDSQSFYVYCGRKKCFE